MTLRSALLIPAALALCAGCSRSTPPPATQRAQPAISDAAPSPAAPMPAEVNAFRPADPEPQPTKEEVAAFQAPVLK
jgi:pilus assembly protein CpaC